MIGRLHVLLPYSFTIPENETFRVYSYETHGMLISVYPPQISTPLKEDGDLVIQINGVKSHQANILWIDFHKEEFDRSIGTECDPPFKFIEEAINEFIERIRYVTNAKDVRPIEFPLNSWQLSYLDNDGNELEPAEGKCRARSAKRFDFSWIAINDEIWNNVHGLPNGWTPIVWKNLLLDANGALPEIGPDLVLAATALEVFIGSTLDQLSKRSAVPQEFWAWVNERAWLKKPSLDEQYDYLLKFLCGKSLKSNLSLWESFNHLKNARNSFVHNGCEVIGDNQVDLTKAKELVIKAKEIIWYVRESLPDELKWPEYEHQLQVTISQVVIKPEEKIPNRSFGVSAELLKISQ